MISYTKQLDYFVHEDSDWFTIWDKENILGSKAMSRNPEMIKYYQKLVSRVVEKAEL